MIESNNIMFAMTDAIQCIYRVHISKYGYTLLNLESIRMDK